MFAFSPAVASTSVSNMRILCCICQDPICSLKPFAEGMLSKALLSAQQCSSSCLCTAVLYFMGTAYQLFSFMVTTACCCRPCWWRWKRPAALGDCTYLPDTARLLPQLCSSSSTAPCPIPHLHHLPHTIQPHLPYMSASNPSPLQLQDTSLSSAVATASILACKQTLPLPCKLV